MKPLIVLLVVFAGAIFSIRMVTGDFDWPLAGTIAMSAMLLFTAVGHFVFVRGMTAMLPAFVPYKKEVIYLTGVFEIAAALGLLIPALTVMTGWLLMVFFVLILPANIKAALRHIDYQTGVRDGNGPAYLWFRIPLQVLFIGWTYVSCIV